MNSCSEAAKTLIVVLPYSYTGIFYILAYWQCLVVSDNYPVFAFVEIYLHLISGILLML